MTETSHVAMFLTDQRFSFFAEDWQLWVFNINNGQTVKGRPDEHYRALQIYSCPMKTHHSSDAHICDLSKAVNNCVTYNYYLGQMRCFRTKISIPVTPFTHDVTSTSKLR